MNYGQESIQALKDEEQVRKRPSVIFGTNDNMGCAHSVFEIIANAVDEAKEGYGDIIKISLFKDGSVEVSDNGRGVPMGWNEAEKKYNWELVFCTLYASGKYDESAYGTSLGLNGLGATATQYASEYMIVESTRNGITSTMKFKKGKPDGELVEKNEGKENGTTIKFKPDLEVFTSIDVPIEYYIDKLRKQAMLKAGLKFEVYHEKTNNKFTLCYEEGLKGFINTICSKPMLEDTLYFSGETTGYDDERDTTPYKLNMRVSLNFSREVSLLEMYHNSSYLSDGGVTFEALKSGLVKAVEEYAKENGKLSKVDKIQFRDIESILVCIGDTNCPGNRTYFKHQTKTAITNPFIKKSYLEFIYHNIKLWLNNSKEKADKVISEILMNKQAREEADKVSRRVVQTLSKSIETIGGTPNKFVNCRSRKVEEKELFIVEGDSALGACKQARDSNFQAIMPIRGKIMNCLKEELTRILGSEVIINLLRVLGCGVEAESKYIKDLPRFKLENLKWNKIIICTDADLDGNQIRCLLIACIYRLAPTLLKEGKVFIAETPLYEIFPKGKDKLARFAYNENEKSSVLESFIKEGYKEESLMVNRSKGLGENEPEMLSVSTMAPETRRLIPIEYPENDENVHSIFEALLGDDIESRRIIINEYFDMVEANID